ncbi:WGxxGxxG family protein [Mycobacterium sp. pW049]|uniref:WGxxGxxG family protein n=1 Tax=[Mycobacterium] bulgaricum TaxID=3238985 RepID=UPI00351B2FD7
MHKPFIIGTAALALLFGGTGIASATDTAVPAATTTVVAQEVEQEDGDNTGLWGLAGLLGLVGLAGLKRRRDTDVRVNPNAGTVNPPRV